jgi:hypothetical protein
MAMALVMSAACAASGAAAQAPGVPELVAALQRGGYVIVMRHAHAPEAPPSGTETDRENRNGERQLDAAGRASASAMGSAMRRLRVPVGIVWSSPTYRAVETARLARLRSPRIVPELGDNGRSMQATNDTQGAWLRTHANQTPRRGTDTVIVTQYPNIAAAFGNAATGMKDGEALVLRPGPAGPQVVGRIGMDQWPSLARGPKEGRNDGA